MVALRSKHTGRDPYIALYLCATNKMELRRINRQTLDTLVLHTYSSSTAFKDSFSISFVIDIGRNTLLALKFGGTCSPFFSMSLRAAFNL